MEFVSMSLIGVALVSIVTYFLYIKWLRSKYPPGPFPLPIIGNLQLLSRRPQFDLARLAKDYGPVFTIWMGNQPTVIISTYDVIKAAQVEKGKVFAGKAMDSTAFKIVLNGNEEILARQYDDKTIMMRKLVLSIMKRKGIGELPIHDLVNDEMKHLIDVIKDGVRKPQPSHLLIRLPVSNVLMRTLFDFRFQNTDDPKYFQWLETNKTFFSAVEFTMLINFWPILWYIVPMLRKIIRKGAADYDNFIYKHLKEHEETYQEGNIRDFTDLMIKSMKDQTDDLTPSQQLTRVNIAGVLKDCFAGGTNSTTSAIRLALLVLLHRPDIQKKIQLELDQCFFNKKINQDNDNTNGGTANQEDFSSFMFTTADRPNLPYLTAFVYEALRRCTLGPLSLPRKILIDTSVAGIRIPEGTAVIFNFYTSHMDNNIWERPFEFMPERFLDANGQFDKLKSIKCMIFGGGGPRQCVGQYLAKILIFTCLANILHKFELSCPSVAELPGVDDGVYQIEYSPLDFDICFKLRSS